MENIIFISKERIESVLTYDSLMKCMEHALRNFSQKRVVQPVRTVVPVEKEGGFFGLMPSLCEDGDVLGTKLVTFYPNNMTRYGVATHNAIIVLFETRTGLPKAIMDGEAITTMRTAAVSAVATKILAVENATKLAILGSGVQARSHFQALSNIIQFKEVTVWSKTYENAAAFAKSIGGKACKTASDAVQDADVIVTVTGATSPVLKAEWVKPTAHINAVGACRPDWSEIDPDLMRASVLYVDSREGALKESGDVILSKAEIYAELGEVIAGQKAADRDKLTVFKSLGMSIEDTMAGQLVLDLVSGKD